MSTQILEHLNLNPKVNLSFVRCTYSWLEFMSDLNFPIICIGHESVILHSFGQTEKCKVCDSSEAKISS